MGDSWFPNNFQQECTMILAGNTTKTPRLKDWRGKLPKPICLSGLAPLERACLWRGSIWVSTGRACGRWLALVSGVNWTCTRYSGTRSIDGSYEPIGRTIAWASSSASCQPSDPKSAQGPDYLGAKCCIQACCRSRCQTSGWWYGGISGSSHSVSFTFPSTNGPQTKPGQIGPGRINFIVSTWPTR